MSYAPPLSHAAPGNELPQPPLPPQARHVADPTLCAAPVFALSSLCLRTLATPCLSVLPDSRPSPTQTALRPLSARRPLLPWTWKHVSMSTHQIPRRKPCCNSTSKSKTTCSPKTRRRTVPVCRTITVPPIWPRKWQRKGKREREEETGTGKTRLEMKS